MISPYNRHRLKNVYVNSSAINDVKDQFDLVQSVTRQINVIGGVTY